MNNTNKIIELLKEYDFQNRLHTLRQNKNISQEQIGEVLGIDGKSYGKYEQFANAPKIDNLIRLAQYFDVSLDYLILGKETTTIERVSSLLGKYDESVQEKVLVCIENMLSMMFPDNTP